MFLQKDKSLFKAALKADILDYTCGTELQRRILDLTQNFMMPLENYVSSLMPLKKHLSPFKVLFFALNMLSMWWNLSFVVGEFWNKMILSLLDNIYLYHLYTLQNIPQIYPFVLENFFSALDETRIMQTSGIRGDWRGNFLFLFFSILRDSLLFIEIEWNSKSIS